LIAVGVQALIAEFAYYLVVPRSNVSRTNIAAFRSWILQAISGTSKERQASRIEDVRFSRRK
jgi:hypothetical protein